MKRLVLGIITSVVLSALLSVPMLSLPSFDQPAPFMANLTNFSIPLDSIVRIQCGDMMGTAEVIDGNTLLTASHVVDGHKECIVTDMHDLASVRKDSHDLDYAILYTETGDLGRMPINCGGFITGETYMMVGYANGRDFVVQTAIATREFSDLKDWKTGQLFTHVRTLRGYKQNVPTAIPGMSGGPILNIQGEIVGIVVAAPTNDNDPKGYAREMRDTTLCQSSGSDK